METWRARLATLVASMNKLIRASGLAAILGTLLYATSDVLLVGVAANLVDYPNLQPPLITDFLGVEVSVSREGQAEFDVCIDADHQVMA